MTALWVWIAGAASYLILVGSLDLDEVAAAVLLGALGAALHGALLRAGARRFVVDRRAMEEIGRALRRLPGATLRVGALLVAALWRGAGGRQVERGFAAGRQDVARDAGRRAVVVLATSLAPDSYVVWGPRGDEAMLLHSLTRPRRGDAPRRPS